MFKISLFLLGVAAVVGLILIISPCSEKDRADYQALCQSSNPLKNGKIASCCQQKRTAVCKRIWYQDDTPLQICIESPESELVVTGQHNKLEVVEKFKHVVCLMQEELYYEGERPMQKIRYLEGDEACYHYNSHLFASQNVKIQKYQLEGHTLPEPLLGETPIMSGVAGSVTFMLKGKELDFTAHQMRATLNTGSALL